MNALMGVLGESHYSNVANSIFDPTIGVHDVRVVGFAKPCPGRLSYIAKPLFRMPIALVCLQIKGLARHDNLQGHGQLTGGLSIPD